MAEWVARYGLPCQLTTDQGTQFTLGTWGSWCKRMSVVHMTTSAFHPQSNGMVERLHRQNKNGLHACGSGVAWLENLPWVLMGIMAAPKDKSNISTAEATLGQQMVMPSQLQLGDVRPENVPRGPDVIPASQRTYAEAVSRVS